MMTQEPVRLRRMFSFLFRVWLSLMLITSLISTLPVHSKEVKLYGSVNELVMLCQSAGITLSDNKLPSTVLNVKLGSTALHAGICKNDKVLSASVDQDVLQMQFQRDGKVYQAKIAIAPAAFRALQGKSAPLAAKVDNQNIATGIDKKPIVDDDLQVLKDYKVVMIVDRSGSMSEDCSLGEPKWVWVGENMAGFARYIMPVAPGGLRTITFNHQYEDHGVLSPSEVENLFVTLLPKGGTDAATPIGVALDSYHTDGKGMIICVLTDGLTNEQDLQQVLNRAAGLAQPGMPLVIAFFQIGVNDHVSAFLSNVSGLVKGNQSGPQLDIYRSFPDLVRAGLARSLVEAIQTVRNGTQKSGGQMNAIQPNAVPVGTLVRP